MLLIVLNISFQVLHSTQSICKPQAKSNEAAQREIEEAMCRVKEAQHLISAAIDPVIGLLSKDKRRYFYHFEWVTNFCLLANGCPVYIKPTY